MTHPVLAIARNDLADAARSKLLWGAVLVLLVVSVPGYLGAAGGRILETPTRGVRFLPQALVNFVAPVALVVAHRAVVGERESGSLRVLFGHPVARRDVVLGKLLGRSALAVAVATIAMLGLGAATVYIYGSLPVTTFLAMTAYVAAYAVVWTAVVVGISAAAATRLQAISAGLGLFLFFGPFQLWSTLALPAFALAFTGSTSLAAINPLDPGTWPTWYEYVLRVNPMENFVQTRYAVAGLVDGSTGGGLLAASAASFLLWATVPVAIGYWRFERSDLA
ncbi:ABC transporter permease subunit [Halorubellus litoreus]|uniref:ABC transporter permease subunit n=1 Tax=Halorubellus litoreus TaxID=755308 RepID=A0ABD5VEW9_9EURY